MGISIPSKSPVLLAPDAWNWNVQDGIFRKDLQFLQRPGPAEVGPLFCEMPGCHRSCWLFDRPLWDLPRLLVGRDNLVLSKYSSNLNRWKYWLIAAAARNFSKPMAFNSALPDANSRIPRLSPPSASLLDSSICSLLLEEATNTPCAPRVSSRR